jgi:hypothetical protein
MSDPNADGQVYLEIVMVNAEMSRSGHMGPDAAQPHCMLRRVRRARSVVYSNPSTMRISRSAPSPSARSAS